MAPAVAGSDSRSEVGRRSRQRGSRRWYLGLEKLGADKIGEPGTHEGLSRLSTKISCTGACSMLHPRVKANRADDFCSGLCAILGIWHMASKSGFCVIGSTRLARKSASGRGRGCDFERGTGGLASTALSMNGILQDPQVLYVSMCVHTTGQHYCHCHHHNLNWLPACSVWSLLTFGSFP